MTKNKENSYETAPSAPTPDKLKESIQALKRFNCLYFFSIPCNTMCVVSKLKRNHFNSKPFRFIMENSISLFETAKRSDVVNT